MRLLLKICLWKLLGSIYPCGSTRNSEMKVDIVSGSPKLALDPKNDKHRFQMLKLLLRNWIVLQHLRPFHAKCCGLKWHLAKADKILNSHTCFNNNKSMKLTLIVSIVEKYNTALGCFEPSADWHFSGIEFTIVSETMAQRATIDVWEGLFAEILTLMKKKC